MTGFSGVREPYSCWDDPVHFDFPLDKRYWCLLVQRTMWLNEIVETLRGYSLRAHLVCCWLLLRALWRQLKRMGTVRQDTYPHVASLPRTSSETTTSATAWVVLHFRWKSWQTGIKWGLHGWLLLQHRWSRRDVKEETFLATSWQLPSV